MVSIVGRVFVLHTANLGFDPAPYSIMVRLAQPEVIYVSMCSDPGVSLESNLVQCKHQKLGMEARI